MKYFLFEAKEGTFIDGGFYLQQFHAIYSSQQKRSMVDNFYGREGAMGKRIFSLAFRVKWTPRESSDLIDYRHRASRFSGPSHQTTLMALIANKFRTMRMIWEVIESPVYNKNWRTAEPEQGWSSWLKRNATLFEHTSVCMDTMVIETDDHICYLAMFSLRALCHANNFAKDMNLWMALSKERIIELCIGV